MCAGVGEGRRSPAAAVNGRWVQPRLSGRVRRQNFPLHFVLLAALRRAALVDGDW